MAQRLDLATPLTLVMTDTEMQETEGLLPPYTLRELSRELRCRSVLLCWRAQHLRTRSEQLLHKHAGGVSV